MLSVWGGCRLLAAPTIPALRRSHRRRPSISRSLLPSPNPTAPKPRPITAATSDADGDVVSTNIFQTLSPLQREQVSVYVRALLEWNQRMNLTAVTGESEVMARHVEDSLAIIPPLRSHYFAQCCREGERVSADRDHLNVVDVGTGPGLPGLILAIACPNWKLTLLESMQKRCLFLDHAIALTGLSNVQVLCDRAEDRVLARSRTSEKYLMLQLQELLQK